MSGGASRGRAEETEPASQTGIFRNEAVLEAAGELFAERGFEATSFRDLTGATGIKRSLLLYHYGSKEELWRRAMLHIVARFDAAAALRQLPGADAPDAERVDALLRANLDALIAVPAYGKVLVREGVRAGPRLDWLVAHFVPGFAFGITFADAGILVRMRSTMLRDLVIGGMLTATALGPFLEASTAAASRMPTAGIHPMSPERREELIALIAGMILRPAS